VQDRSLELLCGGDRIRVNRISGRHSGDTEAPLSGVRSSSKNSGAGAASIGSPVGGVLKLPQPPSARRNSVE
jgi:hypothetical protein